MSLNSVVFTVVMILVIIFGSLFFSEWTEKHTTSFTMKLFAQIGMPALLWSGMLLLYELLRQKGWLG